MVKRPLTRKEGGLIPLINEMSNLDAFQMIPADREPFLR